MRVYIHEYVYVYMYHPYMVFYKGYLGILFDPLWYKAAALCTVEERHSPLLIITAMIIPAIVLRELVSTQNLRIMHKLDISRKSIVLQYTSIFSDSTIRLQLLYHNSSVRRD